MKVLVIGGTGFIGSHVVDALLEAGKQIRILDRRTEVFREPLPGIEYVLGDLADSALLTEALIGIDAVVHLASSTVPYTSNLNPVADISGNLIGAVRLLEAMRSVGVHNILYISSGGTVYGLPQTDPVGEDHPLMPITSYGIVKLAVEKYLHMHSTLYGLRYCVLRPSNPYGPRQGHSGVQGIIGTYLWKIARDEPIEVWGDGTVVRDFIHVRDLAELVVRALGSEVTGVFNAGQGEGHSIAEIVAAVGKVVGSELRPVYKPGRGFDVPRVVLDIARAKETFAWVPRKPLEVGIAETWAWVQEQPR